jgi:hypothetical protein
MSKPAHRSSRTDPVDNTERFALYRTIATHILACLSPDERDAIFLVSDQAEISDYQILLRMVEDADLDGLLGVLASWEAWGEPSRRAVGHLPPEWSFASRQTRLPLCALPPCGSLRWSASTWPGCRHGLARDCPAGRRIREARGGRNGADLR